MIQDPSGWFDSSNGGDSFNMIDIEGLPRPSQTYDMDVGGSKLWVLAQSGDDADAGSSSIALFAADLGGGPFARVSALPDGALPEAASFSLRYSDGVLIAAGARTYLSADQGATFTEAELQPAGGLGVAATSYAAGHVYRVVGDTLYVDALRP